MRAVRCAVAAIGGMLLLRPAVGTVRDRLDYRQVWWGAAAGGERDRVMVGHGRSDTRSTVVSAISAAFDAVESGMLDAVLHVGREDGARSGSVSESASGCLTASTVSMAS